jgi:parallel beta-helix repeat protein
MNAQGIFVQSSRRLLIENNRLSENSRFGLRMSSATGCNVTDNIISKNQIAGANLVDCTASFLYHNAFLDNGPQNAADNGANQWDAGPRLGGNYWSDHEVLGNPGRTPKQIPSKGVDRYPFQEPGGWR